MPTTSNFGWTTPADTDLVKDGAAAIRTLGNGVDSSFVDLKGGTTGQVLAKNSNTDLDFTWSAAGDITEVQAGTGISVASGTGPIPVITNTVATAFDAAGDLVYGTGADTFTKLAIGTAGQVLKVNSGATAPEWGAAAGGGFDWSLVNAGGTALTGAATITVSGITGADKLMVIIDEASSASASSEIAVRLNTDTGSNYYSYGGYGVYPTSYSTGNFDRIAGAQDKIYMATMSSAAGSRANGYVQILGANASGVKTFICNGAASQSSGNGPTFFNIGGYYNSASTISSVSVVSSIGNFDNGTIYVYKSA